MVATRAARLRERAKKVGLKIRKFAQPKKWRNHDGKLVVHRYDVIDQHGPMYCSSLEEVEDCISRCENFLLLVSADSLRLGPAARR